MADRYGERYYGMPERDRYDEERERYRDEYARESGRFRGEGHGYPSRFRMRDRDPDSGGGPWEPEGGYEREYGAGRWRSPERRSDSPERRWESPERRSGRPESPEDRGFLNRAGDEVRSWFGDEGARRRRRMDEREGDRESRYYGFGERDYDDRGWSERGYGEHGGRGRESWGFGPWPGGRHLQEEWRQWGVEPSARRRQEYSTTPRWKDWADFSWFRDEPFARRGPHTGRGPRGYQRSDQRIAEDVCERLTQNGDLDASNIEIHVAAGEVTLQGTVDSRWAKRLAEDLADDISGVRQVHNQLRIGTEAAEQPAPQQSPPRPWPERDDRAA